VPCDVFGFYIVCELRTHVFFLSSFVFLHSLLSLYPPFLRYSIPLFHSYRSFRLTYLHPCILSVAAEPPVLPLFFLVLPFSLFSLHSFISRDKLTNHPDGR
jgi:hypothetical protein